MEAGTSVRFQGQPRTRDRAAAAFLLVVLAAASIVFWIGVPLLVLWALSKVTESFTVHFVAGLIGAPTAMVLFAPVLFWINSLYLRVTGVSAPPPEERPRRLRGPLEPILLWTLPVALGALFVWFFLFAENPPHQVI
jgi:hypothetical protein